MLKKTPRIALSRAVVKAIRFCRRTPLKKYPIRAFKQFLLNGIRLGRQKTEELQELI
jgi:hypothetical protein